MIKGDLRSGVRRTGGSSPLAGASWKPRRQADSPAEPYKVFMKACSPWTPQAATGRTSSVSTGCCTALLYEIEKALSRSWERAFELQNRRGESNPKPSVYKVPKRSSGSFVLLVAKGPAVQIRSVQFMIVHPGGSQQGQETTSPTYHALASTWAPETDESSINRRSRCTTGRRSGGSSLARRCPARHSGSRRSRNFRRSPCPRS